jgi:glycosyltransferase involved in cell wall biosynthesis
VYYGGPIHATYGLCNALAAVRGIRLEVLATDAAGPCRGERVAAGPGPVRYPGYDVHFMHRRAGKDLAPGLLLRLGPMVRRADVVHITGVYSSPTIPALMAARAIGRPVLWSPRGALLASHVWRDVPKARLKTAFEAICSRVMPEGTCLHVTSEEEGRASLARLPAARAVMIPNGIDVPAAASPRRSRGEGLRLMFIGRLHPVKALENLIAAMALAGDVAATLAIHGEGERSYVAGLRRLASSLGVGDCVRFCGSVAGEAKARAFADADVCVLASHTENFGMAVAEALAHGVPVIVSRGVPWAEVERHGCGIEVDNAPEALGGAIRSMAGRDLLRMGDAGRRWMQRDFAWAPLAARMLAAMRQLTGAAP